MGILAIGGIKGGSGKTTLATNLAVMRSKNHKVLLVDADEQRSTSKWAAQRDVLGIPTDWSTIQLFGKTLHTQIQRLGADYDDVIIDVGGRDTTSQRSALAIADMYLMPFRPRSLDVWTLAEVKVLLSDMSPVNPSLQAYAILNQADSTGTDNQEATEILKECEEIRCLDMPITMRKAFGNAASNGLGVAEMSKRDLKAIQEMTMLYDFLYTKTI